MQKLDQKQKVLVALMGTAAAGFFGKFVYEMVKVTPAAAHTQTASANAQQTKSTTAKPAPGSTQTASTTQTAADETPQVPPPTPDMRDPFTPGIADDASMLAYQKSLQMARPVVRARSGAWNKPSVPFVAPLPRPSDDYNVPAPSHADFSVAPLPTAATQIAPPTWTVTGLVDGGDSQMAILRSGDSRRMVRPGDMVDGDYRVVGIGNGHVTLAHGHEKYTLMLGAKPTAPQAPASSATAGGPPQPNTPQDLGAPSQPVTGLPAGTVTPGGTEINPNGLIKLPGGLTLPTVHLPAN